jgi:hypothetical protein
MKLDGKSRASAISETGTVGEKEKQRHVCPSDRASTVPAENFRIRFSENWNGKLDKEYFTTIRKYDGEKSDYYKRSVHQAVDVHLGFNVVGKAECLSCEDRNRLKDLPYGLLVCDTGSENPIEIFNRFGIVWEDRVILLCYGMKERSPKITLDIHDDSGMSHSCYFGSHAFCKDCGCYCHKK